KDMVNLTVTGNTIQDTGGTGDAWDAGAGSVQSIESGAGSVEATVDSTSTYRMFGLSHANRYTSYTDIDYAAYLAGNALMVYENGVLRGTYGTLAVGDVVKVAVKGARGRGNGVRYFLNGRPVYTSSTPPTYPLNL